jgi:hypothetical protein
LKPARGLDSRLYPVNPNCAVVLGRKASGNIGRLMEQTHIFAALQGVRGRSSVDLAMLDQLLVRFSRLVAEQRRIKEIDINPDGRLLSRLIAQILPDNTVMKPVVNQVGFQLHFDSKQVSGGGSLCCNTYSC